MVLSEDVINFFEQQHYTIVSTIGSDFLPHSSCKGIVKITQDGKVYLLDLYSARTHENLRKNNVVSITAVDEHKFKGYCLKGRAKILKPSENILNVWKKKIATRITKRIIKNMMGEKGHTSHPESLLPEPAYMIVIDVESVTNLTPKNMQA